MVDSDFESNMSRTSNRTRAVMRPPCAKLVSRIRASSCFLVGLHRKHNMSLTESAAFLRDGVLGAWTNTSAAKRQRVIYWAAKQAKPVDPLKRLVLRSGRPHLVTTYKTDDLLTSVWVLEALRMLSKTHRPGLRSHRGISTMMGEGFAPSCTSDATGILPLSAGLFYCRALIAMKDCLSSSARQQMDRPEGIWPNQSRSQAG